MSYVVDHYRKVRTTAGLGHVADHNNREGVYDGKELPEWISHPERRNLNEYHSEHDEVHKARVARINEAKLPRKPQKNASAAIEVVISASPEWFDQTKPEVWKAYFKDARAWIGEAFGAEQIIGWSTHYDEKTPHMHLLLVPLTQTKEVLNKESGKREIAMVPEWRYSSSTMLGGPKGLVDLHTLMAKVVGQKYGLERGVARSTARHANQVAYAKELAERAGKSAERSHELDTRDRQIALKEGKIVGQLKAIEGFASDVEDRQERISHTEAILRKDPNYEGAWQQAGWLKGVRPADVPACFQAFHDKVQMVVQSYKKPRERPKGVER